MKVQLLPPILSLVTATALEKRQAYTIYKGRVVSYQGAKLYGTTSKPKINEFLKIPYAEPPLGDLRFRPPIDPKTSMSGSVLLDQLGPKCMQVSTSPQDNTSEDCLHLNIYSPRTGENLPVVVYIHGGSFTGGSAINNDASWLAKEQNLVVVTVNYRLGVFGFMAGNELKSETNYGGQSSLNAGLLDQKKAFEWVRANIAAFGGDPTKITAMGQSAGAISIGVHLLAQAGGQKLFDRAYLISGAVPLISLQPWQLNESFVMYANAVGCSTANLACLRQLSAAQLNAESAAYPTFPVVDGNYIIGQGYSQLIMNNISKVPLFIHTNKDEGSVFPLFLGLTDSAPTIERIRSFIPILREADKDELVKNYDPVTNPIYPGAAFGDFFSDLFFYCPSNLMADIFATKGVPVYTSRNNHIPLANPFADWPVPTGVYHSAELIYIFNCKSLSTKTEKKFGGKIRNRIKAFASGNTPDSSWTTYSVGSNAAYDIDTGSVIYEDKTQKCSNLYRIIRENS
jgi:para-nitrobenzyl esterase